MPPPAAPSPLIVSPAEAGMKLLRFLERRLGASAPRSMLYKWLRTGQVRVNKGRAKAHDILAEGDAVRVPPFAAPREIKESGPSVPCSPDAVLPAPGILDLGPGLTLAAKAGDVLVLNKAAGLASQPGGGDSVSARLASAFADSAFVPAPAHRLDRHTSGLMLAGLTHRAQQGLHALIKEGGMVKEYLVWVCGGMSDGGPLLLRDSLFTDNAGGRELVAARPECAVTRQLPDFTEYPGLPPQTPSAGGAAQMSSPSLRSGRTAPAPQIAEKHCQAMFFGYAGSRDGQSLAGCGAEPHSKKDRLHHSSGTTPACCAATFVARLEPDAVPAALCAASPLLASRGATLLLVRLFTGRKHQIRVQFASRGHPVIGDGRYGGPRFERMLLHAYALSFNDPGSGEPRAFSALPDWPAPFAPDETAVRAARERLAAALG